MICADDLMLIHQNKESVNARLEEEQSTGGSMGSFLLTNFGCVTRSFLGIASISTQFFATIMLLLGSK